VVDQLSTDELLAEIHRSAAVTKHPVLIVSGNARGIVLAQRNPTMRRAYDLADVVRVDGAALALAARMQGVPAVARSTWADLIWDLAASLEHCGQSLYLIGARSDVLDIAAQRIQRRHPGLRLAGRHHGYFDQSEGSTDSRSLIADLRASEPDVVIVGLGMPRQERWLLDHLDQLPPAVYLTAGAVFDYASGTVRRPPAWMCDHGLEWFGRILVEPRRLLRRYAADLPRFAWLALVSAVPARRSASLDGARQ
jgi:N-acetylglucosaminyldiphosphoundecaprenol N-acetyl-beta-D-mannosaminyltransferase